MKEVEALERWLARTGPHGYVLMASHLGYTTGEAIKLWIKRRRIPANRIIQVMRIVNKGVGK